MSDWEWDPDAYLATMLDEIPGYEDLQEAVAAATTRLDAGRVLELGSGTGETALRILERHPESRWVGIDASAAMLGRARERLPGADLRLQRLEDELPPGLFDLVVVMDLPDSVDDQLAWLHAAGFEATAHAVRIDLAVFEARLTPTRSSPAAST